MIMSEGKTSLEVIAPSIREAIQNGLSELGVSEEMVDIEVLDTGSRGLFGMGSRQARVRLTLKDVESDDSGPALPVASVVSVVPPAPFVPPAVEAPAPVRKEPEDDLLRVARETVQELLKHMKIRARVISHYGEPEDEQATRPVWVDIQGDDLSILIGPRSETLNALQYIASLIVSKEIGHNLTLVVDVQGFRARREQQIRQMARRMAEQAIKTGRRQVLEPMPASERRLVHIELRKNPLVTTESIGEEPRRKVTINPKNA
jgi:spoIIIJ-associated protein